MADGFTALYRTGWSPRRVERPTASRGVAPADPVVRCEIRRVAPEAVVEESALDADPDTRDRLITLVLTQARQLGDALLGLAVDRGGTSRPLDLDGVVLGRPVPVDHVPDLLILRPEVAVRHPELSRCGLRVCGPFTAFDPAGLLDRF